VVTAGATHGRMVGLQDRRPSSVLTRASPDSVLVADPSCGAAQPTRCRRVRTPQAPVNARPSFRRFRLKLVERKAHWSCTEHTCVLKTMHVLKPFLMVFADRRAWFFSNNGSCQGSPRICLSPRTLKCSAPASSMPPLYHCKSDTRARDPSCPNHQRSKMQTSAMRCLGAAAGKFGGGLRAKSVGDQGPKASVKMPARCPITRCPATPARSDRRTHRGDRA
jgi:hypothetical protein